MTGRADRTVVVMEEVLVQTVAGMLHFGLSFFGVFDGNIPAFLPSSPSSFFPGQSDAFA